MLETLALSIFNHDCAIASAASRMVTAATAGRSSRWARVGRTSAPRSPARGPLTSPASPRRRTCRPATSTASRRSGTSAHAFTLLHDDERRAFAAQVDALGTGTTLLVDTYDVPGAIRTAVELAGPSLGAIRIDSGDLAIVAREVRVASSTRSARPRPGSCSPATSTSTRSPRWRRRRSTATASGTSLVTGSGAPTAALVYKLVARPGSEAPGPLRPVAKRSVGKPSRGGRKWARAPTRRDQVGPKPRSSRITSPPSHRTGRALLTRLVHEGEVVGREPIAEARARHRRVLAELPPHALQLSRGYPAIPTVFEPDRD